VFQFQGNTPVCAPFGGYLGEILGRTGAESEHHKHCLQRSPRGAPRVQQVQRRVECKRLDVAAVAPQHKVGVGRPATSAAAAAAAGVRSHQHSASSPACASVQCQQAPAVPAQAPAPR
jgi:hypothetical protein